jgi:hypothetical protein
MRTLITTVAVVSAVIAPAAAAEARAPVTRAAVSVATHRLAEQAATGIEDVTNGAASIDRSRTSVATTCATAGSAWARRSPSSGPTP